VGTPWTLDQVLDRISRENPSLAQAEALLREAQAGVTMGQAGFWPELSLGLDYGASTNPAQAFALRLNQDRVDLGNGLAPNLEGTDNWRKEVRVDWVLWDPTRSAQLRAAEAWERSARADSSASEHRLRLAGVQGWFQLKAAVAMQEVLADSIGVVQERLTQTSKRQAEGAALKADVLRLEVRLAQARQESADAELMVHTTRSALNRLMARPPAAELPTAEAPDTAWLRTPLSENPAELIAQALASRPDLRAAQERLRSLEFRAQAARKAGGAQVVAFGAYDVDGHDLGFDTDLDSTSVGIGVRLPLSKRTAARREAGQAQADAARAGLQSLAQSIESQVSDAHQALRVARQQLELASSAIATAEEAYRIVAESQDAGGATVTDVLEAELARRKARVSQVTSQFRVQIALANLAQAVGILR